MRAVSAHLDPYLPAGHFQWDSALAAPTPSPFAFLAPVETGRFHYWTDDEDSPLSDGWWFWKQAEACAYELPPGGTWERDSRWEVPAAARVSTPGGSVATHDDRLVSAALVAMYDELVAGGQLRTGRAESRVVPAADPLDDLTF